MTNIANPFANQDLFIAAPHHERLLDFCLPNPARFSPISAASRRMVGGVGHWSPPAAPNSTAAENSEIQ